MKAINIHSSNNDGLEINSDSRGVIADVFYNTNINHVAYIKSVPNAIRGNHYHKQSTQHILITSGSLEYWYKKLDSNEAAQVFHAKIGDLITTEPFEIHALKIGEDGNEFIVFTEGKRGGTDYESDTFRVDSIIS
jgi:dTDP-4-dehydrorhamnose 3,5-epimerase-like enzyme